MREIFASDRVELVVGQSVVHQDVHGAESVRHRADHLTNRPLVGDVGAVGESFAAALPDAADDLLRTPFALEIVHGHGGAFSRQGFSYSRADPATRAGDEGHLTFENTHDSSLRRHYPDQVQRVGARVLPLRPLSLSAPRLLFHAQCNADATHTQPRPRRSPTRSPARVDPAR